MISTQQLFGQVYLLSPGERAHRLILAARELAVSDPAELDDLLARLYRGDATQRRLSVLMAGQSGRGAHLAMAVHDPDSSVCAMALTSPGFPDPALVGVIESGPLRLRQLAYRVLRQQRRTAVAASVLAPVRERWGDREAAAVLTACDPATIEQQLPGLADAIGNWTTLSMRHPAVVAGFARAELAGLDGFRARRWWVEHASLMAALIRADPGSVLDLAEQHPGGLPQVLRAQIVRLAGVDPARTAALLLADPARATTLLLLPLSRRACERLATVDDDLLGRLLAAATPRAAMFTALLRAVPPPRRSAVLRIAYDGGIGAATLIPFSILELFPVPARHQQARRMLALPAVRRLAELSRRIASFLPVAEAQPLLRAATTSAEAADRAQAYALMLTNAGRDGSADDVAELLGWLARIRNERDPVRLAVLQAAADLPLHTVTPSSVAALDVLVRDALDARDTSTQTSATIARLAFRVLWQSAAEPGGTPTAQWALDTVQRLGGWQSHAISTGLELVPQLRRGQEVQLWQFLQVPIARYLERGNPWPLLRLAAVLGPRAYPLKGLQTLLGRATHGSDTAVIRESIRLWLAAPRTRGARAVQLISDDTSVVTLDQVFGVLTTRRTDLLEEYVLLGEPLHGRFSTSDSRWVPIIAPRLVQRWNPLQQALYQSLLVSGTADVKGSRYHRTRYTRALAATPGGGPEAVQALIQDSDELVAEAALTGLAHSSRPVSALPVLLAALGGDRARVAVHAASRCTGWLPPDALAPLLEPLLAAAPKVVVRKEAARLLALNQPPGAVDALLAAWHRDGEHRDVRIAVAASLVPFLADPRALEALTEAAASPDPHLARAVADVSWPQIPPALRPAVGELIRVVSRHPDPETASHALTVLPYWFRWTPGAADELESRLADLNRYDVWRSAARSAAMPLVWTQAPGLPARLAAALIELLELGEDAGVTTDRSALHRLTTFVQQFCRGAAELRREPDAAQRLSAKLAEVDLLAPLAGALQVLLATPRDDPGSSPLLTAAQLLRGRPVAAAELAAGLPADHWDTGEARQLVDQLTERDDAASGLFAVAVTRSAGPDSQWSQPWRQRLRTLRRHPEPDVRDAALAVRTADD